VGVTDASDVVDDLLRGPAPEAQPATRTTAAKGTARRAGVIASPQGSRSDRTDAPRVPSAHRARSPTFSRPCSERRSSCRRPAPTRNSEPVSRRAIRRDRDNRRLRPPRCGRRPCRQARARTVDTHGMPTARAACARRGARRCAS
jgi:hypothetical protein